MFAESLKVQLADAILYPDGMVSCGKAQAGDEPTVTDPRLIIEVPSPSTRCYDKHDKWMLYRGLPSLREYAWIAGCCGTGHGPTNRC